MTSPRSYRALLGVPSLAQVLVAMQIGRVAATALNVALVLFALDEYDSPALAGAVAFFGIFPGLMAAPVVGALLDRFGRVRLIALDYLSATAGMALICVLSIASALPAVLLVAITFVFGVTYMFSDAGLRSLFPRLVPDHLWERVNAIDSNGYLVASVLGAPLAATLIGTVGGPATFAVVGAMFGAAAVALRGVPEPPGPEAETGHLARQAWEGLRYVWRNQTLRGLGVSVSVTNVAWGIGTILVPVIIVDRLAAPEPLVGLAFAVSGVVGFVSALVIGRADTRGRERSLVVAAKAGIAASVALLFPAVRTDSATVGVTWIVVSMAVLGFSAGLWDIGIFTVRQRRTEPRMMGRAFAISIAFNQLGVPAGAALAGALATGSIEWAIAIGVAAAALGSILAAILVPAADPSVERADDAALNGTPASG